MISFESRDDEPDVKEIMNQIETAMNNAKTSEGKARFADFEGASQMKELAKLQDYNESKQEERMEKARDARESTIKNLDETSSKDVVNKAYQEFKDGDIGYDQYMAILDSVKNTNGNIDREELEGKSTKDFVECLEDHDMLDQYVKENLDDKSNFYLKQVKEDYKNKNVDKATYESIYLGIIQSGPSFIKNASDNKLSNSVPDQVKESTYKWTNAIKNMSNTSIKEGEEKSYLDKMQESETNELRQEKDKDVKDGAGSVIWKEGDKEISRGKKIDRKELKKLGDLESTTVNGHELNYMVRDGELVVFKDNPKLTYFTEEGKQGKFNYAVGGLNYLYANFRGGKGIKDAGNFGKKKINNILDRNVKSKNNGPIKKERKEYGEFSAGMLLQHGIPIWKDIVGTPVPKAGSNEVILYMSEDDGETWDSKVNITVSSDGEVTSNDFSNQDWKDIVKKTLLPWK